MMSTRFGLSHIKRLRGISAKETHYYKNPIATLRNIYNYLVRVEMYRILLYVENGVSYI